MLKTFVFSDRGPRAENQDSYCLVESSGNFLAAVADGVGGNNGGEVASKFAIEVLQKMLSQGERLQQCFEAAHLGLIEKASKLPHLGGMATTLTAINCRGLTLDGAHCGDSRAYVLRGRGLKQLTNDHTEVAKLISEGRLTKKEAINYPRKNVITSAIGTHKELVVQAFQFDLLPGDRILLLTDGVYSLIPKREITNLSVGESVFESYCENLIEMIKDRGASDNFTLLGVEMGEF